jgi:LAS superfamily LD-carboxypeptidase LdcB
MRPDVAHAFNHMEAAAQPDSVRLIITSGYRYDAEQAELYKAPPRPPLVAPRGKCLHC